MQDKNTAILDALNQFQHDVKNLDQNATINKPDRDLNTTTDAIRDAADKLLAAIHSLALNALDDRF